ncbi:peptide chain release factor H [Anaerovibrio sp. RM50]|uniref:peptide chain release factor H n=1 Tax=Anaerovibrio sp. RM50 TaxID=1200557 RepID=UPI0004880F19|nr:peptide chain release factor H [Anaerovibrio sp. RM50]
MRIQISSGQGPAECERAVALFSEAIKGEYPNMKLISSVMGHNKDCFCSVIMETDQDVSGLEGTIAWICKSPFRPHHKRKNWYIQVKVLPEAEAADENSDYKIEYFHCGGKGGQNVNKVETGVRLTHIATELVVTATEERTQQANRRIAIKKMEELLAQRQMEAGAKAISDARHGHYEIVRGNPVRVYEGLNFRRKM